MGGTGLGHLIKWPIWMCCWAGYGFYLSVLNRVYNLLCICPKQGIISCESVLVIIACTIDLIDN